MTTEDQAAVIAGKLGDAALLGDEAAIASLISMALASEPLTRAVLRAQAFVHARAARRVVVAEYLAEHASGLPARHPGARER